MSTSIYNVPIWAGDPGTQYFVNDIVYVLSGTSKLYYYALIDHTSAGTDISTDRDAGKWAGFQLDSNGINIPYFVWQANYSSSVNVNPKVASTKMGDGYEQRMRDGINNVLLVLDLVFENRSLTETTAITHFLYTRAAVDAFIFYPPPPFNVQKKFVCPSFQDRYVFFDNYTIQATFNEVVN